MTPLLFNMMMLAVVALKVLAILLLLNWIDGGPKKAGRLELLPRNEAERLGDIFSQASLPSLGKCSVLLIVDV